MSGYPRQARTVEGSGKGRRPVPVFWMALLLAAAAVAVYSNSLGAPFVFDDFENIQHPAGIRMDRLDVAHLLQAARGRLAQRPVANVSFALNYYLNGYSVFGYHLVNVLIHAANGVLLFFLLGRTLSLCAGAHRQRPDLEKEGAWDPGAQTVAALCALVWVVHPVQTEAVTYVVQRMTSLTAMFYLAAMLFYIAGRRARHAVPKAGFFTACAASGLLALGSKEIAVTLPAALFFYEWYFFQDLDGNWIRKRAVYLALAGFFVLAAGIVYTGKDPSDIFASVLAGYKNRPFTLAERLMTQPRVVVFYLSLLLFPDPSRLNVFHDFPVSRSLIDPVSTLPALALLAAVVFLAAVRARKNRFASFAVFWFFGNLALESSVLPLEMVFEHRLYLPSMFLLAVPVVALARRMRPLWRPLTLVFLVAAIFGAWTYQRNYVWADEVRLLSDCVKKSPNQARPHYGLGGALAAKGRLAEAAAQFERTLAIDPGHKQARNALGAVLARMGRTRAAVAAFQRVLQIDPHYAGAYFNLGKVYRSSGRPEAAARSFEKALELQPNAPEILLQTAWLLATDPDPAVRDGRKALALARRLVRIVGKNQPLALDALAAAYADTGRFDEAARTASNAGELAQRFGMAALAEKIARREAFYRAGRPWREREAP